jgi:hypothetical protein
MLIHLLMWTTSISQKQLPIASSVISMISPFLVISVLLLAIFMTPLGLDIVRLILLQFIHRSNFAQFQTFELDPTTEDYECRLMLPQAIRKILLKKLGSLDCYIYAYGVYHKDVALRNVIAFLRVFGSVA